ncbi:MAG: hypothetical protein C4548_07165 [Desulfobacteraceae bacterium]|jgi:hypothetical protein|nr:MAG: hypothetical protein C4548_07165 [Desulfobacteraceae bacterium]
MVQVKHLTFNKPICAWMVMAALVFSMVGPSIIEAHKCDCAIEGKADPLQTATSASYENPVPACCCDNACAPMPVSGIFLAEIVDRDCMDFHPVCCCASESPPPAVTQSFIKDDRRPSFTDVQFQPSLPSAFMPPIHNFLFCAAFSFERDLERIPPHISSTILLI